MGFRKVILGQEDLNRFPKGPTVGFVGRLTFSCIHFRHRQFTPSLTHDRGTLECPSIQFDLLPWDPTPTVVLPAIEVVPRVEHQD